MADDFFKAASYFNTMLFQLIANFSARQACKKSKKIQQHRVKI
jgi:hypothetical protein